MSPTPQVDALGKAARAHRVLQALQAIEEDLFNLRVQQIRAGASDNDPSPIGAGQGTSSTIAETREKLTKARKAIEEEFASELPAVREIVQERDAPEQRA